MAKKIKTKKRGSFILKFQNGKKLKYRTAEAFSHVNEVLSRGRFINSGEMYAAAKQCANGFEYISLEDMVPGRKRKDLEKRFNNINFEY